ncbi:N-acetylglucosamine kinase [Actinoplanes sp. NPDC049265]|uniref:N-acetylglucosamine kinase n=1 Tax=Actinoplanes sp. NPDC049265 TaxID=3363902 RepID=UPI0037193F7C
MDLVLGVDVGATSTRSVLATTDGQVIARGRAGGANINSSGASLVETLQAVLEPAAGKPVRLGVLGAAGAGGAGRRVFGTGAVEAWRTMGLPGVPVTVTDLEVAFAAGTWEQHGTLLLAGTGALAARFDDGVLVQRCDGYGWLLGDEGSAVWIALRALRAALAALDGRGPATSLVEAAGVTFGIPRVSGTEDHAQAIVADAFRRPPAELGRLAPSVSAAALDGDAVAVQICADAASSLLHTFDSVGPAAQAGSVEAAARPSSAGPVTQPGPAVRGGSAGPTMQGGIVLAGSVLLAPGPVAEAVRQGLRRRTPVEPSEARDGAAGAAAMAIARLTGALVPEAIHARLTRQDQL